MDLVVDIYSISDSLRNSEEFNLVSQLNRCAVSVPSNIAEGAGRSTESTASEGAPTSDNPLPIGPRPELCHQILSQTIPSE